MQTLRTAASLELSLAGLGCNNFGVRIDESASHAVVHTALDAGVTHFDTADVYGNYLSEEYLGRALGSRRADVVIATKFGMVTPPGVAGGSRDWVTRAVEASLTRLGTDWIDLYTLHSPDPETPIEETLAALAALVQAGKVREIGCSNFSVAQLQEASLIARETGTRAFVTVQNECNVLEPNAELGQWCLQHGVGLVPFHPLARGFLTGKYGRDTLPAGTRLAVGPAEWRESLLNDVRFGQVERLAAYAAERGHSLVELALSWLAGAPAVISVICGASNPAQVRTNVAATSAWNLCPSERSEVAELLAPVSVDDR